MGKNIIIRPLKQSDAKDYVFLHNLVWRDAYKHIFPKEVFDERDKNAEKMIKSFNNFINSNSEQINLVAECGGKPIGFMSATLNSNYEHYKNNGYAELMGVYIHPQFQGNGVATKFKNMFVDWAKENGATKFVIGALKDNRKACSIYEKWGGKLDDYKKPFEKLGKKYDEVFYVFKI